MLDVRRLRLLRDLAHLGTIAAVAQSHAYTPSAVSQQLAALQREAGVPLLEHIGRGVTLTPAGTALVQHTETVLAALEAATASLAAARTGLSGTVRIGAFPSAVRTLLPPALVALGRDHPALDLRVIELDPVAMPGALRDLSLDVALLHDYDITPARPDPALDSVPLLDEAVFLAVPEGGTGRGGRRAAGGGPEPRLDRRQPGHALPRRRHADLRDRRLRAQGPPSRGRLRRRARAGRRRAGRRAGPAARGRATTPGGAPGPAPGLPAHPPRLPGGAGTHPAIAACVTALRLSTRGYLRRRDGSVRDGGS